MATLHDRYGLCARITNPGPRLSTSGSPTQQVRPAQVILSRVAVFGLAFGSLAFLTAHRAHLFGVFLLLSAAKAPAGITAGVLRGFSMGESDIRIC